MWRWFFAVTVFPLIWAALCVIDFLTMPARFHAPSVLLGMALAYLTQPLWMWLFTRDEDVWEERGVLLRDTPAVIVPALTTALVAVAWSAFANVGGGDVAPLASLPGQGWRWSYLIIPFAVALAGAGLAVLREQRKPLTLGAVLTLPLSAPLIWLVILSPGATT